VVQITQESPVTDTYHAVQRDFAVCTRGVTTEELLFCYKPRKLVLGDNHRYVRSVETLEGSFSHRVFLSPSCSAQ
jgi:hypothetical protein